MSSRQLVAPVCGSVISPRTKISSFMALLLLVPIPTIGTWLAMVALPNATGKTIFLLSKIWILVFPLLWVITMDRQPVRIPKPCSRGMVAACITGIIIFIGIALGYLLADALNWIDAKAMSEKARSVGLTTPLIYIVGAVYWCTINSILEEYVWRWFVFTRCETLMPRIGAIVASGLFFTLHHIIALAVYFNLPVTVLASMGVFIGGTTWSWLYLRYRNIYAPYISHVFADVIIFIIGYILIFQS